MLEHSDFPERHADPAFPQVHGPINLIGILDLYRDVNEHQSPEDVPKKITYRAMAPLYVGESYRILLEKDSGAEQGEGPKWRAEVVDSFGKTAVKATIQE